MATGTTNSISQDSGYSCSIRLYYSTTFDAATSTSTVSVTPQIYRSGSWSDITFYGYTQTNPGVYGGATTSTSRLYVLNSERGSNNLVTNSGNWGTLSPNSGSISSFTIKHGTDGKATFYGGVVGTAYFLPGDTRSSFDDIAANRKGCSATIEVSAPYSITYNANGGSGAPSSQAVFATYSYNLSSSSPSRTGYTFKGWATSSSATTAQYQPGASVTISGNLSLYAVWQINSYTITCSDRVGSSSGTQLGTQTASYNYGSSVSGASFGSSTAYDAYYTGYHYTGSSSAITVTGAATVYRYFALNTWTVAYNANGGSSTPSSQTKTYGTALTLSPAIARANSSPGSYTVTYNYNGSGKSDTTATSVRTTTYTFSKWNTKQDGSGTNYNASASYTANAAATMYAQWTSSTTAAAVTLPSATRTGYTFDGWYDAASGGSKIGNAGASYTPSANKTLYAHWTIITYTFKATAGTDIASVSLNGTSSATSVTKTVNYGSTNTFIATLGSNVAFNYTFSGWYKGTTKVSSSLTYAPTNATAGLDLTAKASKTAKSYTLSFTKPNTGGSAEVRRTSSPNGGGSIGVLNNGATIYYGDVLQVSYTENPGYEVETHTINGSTFTTPATVTVTGAVNVVVTMKNAGVVWIWNGSTWERYIPMIWNGSSWDRYIPMVWIGSAWEIY